MGPPRALKLSIAAGLLGLTACSSALEPTGAGFWAADLIARQQVLSMIFTRNGSDLTGSGSLADLAATFGDSLSLVGVRYADTIDITFVRVRPVGDHFRFLGWYTPRGTIDGTLDGAEFNREAVTFRSR